MSSSSQIAFLEKFYETTLEVLAGAKNDRLWFSTTIKLCKICFESKDYVKMQKILKVCAPKVVRHGHFSRPFFWVGGATQFLIVRAPLRTISYSFWRPWTTTEHPARTQAVCPVGNGSPRELRRPLTNKEKGSPVVLRRHALEQCARNFETLATTSCAANCATPRAAASRRLYNIVAVVRWVFGDTGTWSRSTITHG